MTTDHDVIADDRRSGLGSSPNRADMMNRAVRSDLRAVANTNGPDVGNEAAGTDFRIGIEVDVREKREYLLEDSKSLPNRPPEETRMGLSRASLDAVEGQCPESLRSPPGIPPFLETSQVCFPGTPLTVPGPFLDSVPIVVHSSPHPNSLLSARKLVSMKFRRKHT